MTDKRYITDIKEMPNDALEVNQIEGEKKKEEKKAKPENIKPEQKEQKKIKKNVPKEDTNKKPNKRLEKTDKNQNMTKKKQMTLGINKNDSSRLPFSTKDIVLGILNIFLLAAILSLLFILPRKAEELKDVRNQNTRNEAIASLKISDVNLQKDKIDAVEKSFLDESGVLDFVRKIEVLKGEGSVVNLSFESQEAVKDRTNNFVLPIEITLVGQREEIKKDVEKIESLPYLFRSVSIDLHEYVPGEDEENVEPGLLQMDLGGVIYVDEKLGKNR